MEKKMMIYTVYAQNDDMTFIMKQTDNSLECVGWYFGKPDEEATKQYVGNLVAEFEE